MTRRVLFVTPYYTPFIGGTTAFVEAMVRRLARAGNRVTVLTTNAYHVCDFWQPTAQRWTTSQPEVMAAASTDPDGVIVERLRLIYPWPAPYAFGVARRAGHWLQRSRWPAGITQALQRRSAAWMPSLHGLEMAFMRLGPEADLIQAEDSSWDGLFTRAAAAARRLNKPFVAHPLMHLGDASIRAHFQMAHQVTAYRRASAVLALSKREADEYVTLGVQPDRVHVIPMGVDVETFEAQITTSPEAFLQDQYGRFMNRPYTRSNSDTSALHPSNLVAFLGANTYDKGAFTLALAVAELNRAGLPVHVAYAGPESDGLAAFLATQPADIRSALADRVHILGLVDQPTKHRLLASSALLALPSQVDTFGIVLLEAWLHGKPVIGAAAGGIPEVIRAEQTGLLVPFGDVAALAAAIRRLIEAPDWAHQLGQAGQQLVLREYTWERTYQILARIYTDLLS